MKPAPAILSFASLLAAAPALAQQESSRMPAPLTAPGDQVIVRIAAVGVQVYECRPGQGGQLAWAFKEPRADLTLMGQPVGRHYAGPTWEHRDGSRIVGRVAANVPAPGAADIPWLRLATTSSGAEGSFTPVTAVQRVDTHGGTLAGRCEAAGAVSEVPYTADYILLRTAR